MVFKTNIVNGAASWSLLADQLDFNAVTTQYPFGESVKKNIHFDPSLPYIYVPAADWTHITNLMTKKSEW